MMKRPRLPRSFYVSLLAIAGLLFLSYFPLARIRAANAGATILPSAGKPLVDLKKPQSVKITYTGAADAVAALQSGTANPTAMAAADFNADGAKDVVAGYSTKNGGVLALFRGNPDAYAPTDSSLYAKAIKGSVPATFLSNAGVFTVPESPDLLVTGDFNRDGKPDVLVAARGGSLYFLAGDGKGNLLAPQPVALADQVMALAATNDGHVAVSTDGRSGPLVTILSPSAAGLIAGQTYSLPARGNSVAWGNLGSGLDVAVGAGANLVVIYSALTSNAQTETVTVPFQVQGLALGDFIWDRDGRTEMSVLADDGSIHILQHGTLNTTPVTAAELPARRAALRGRHAKPTTPPNPTALGAWTIAKQLPYTGSAPSGPVSSSAFNSPRLAASSTPDLMVIDAGSSQLHILDTSGKTASPSADISFSSSPVAALALPQKINSGRDIVVLTSSQAAPTLILTGGDPTFTVTTTADIDPTDICGSSSTTVPSPLSLREAICLANNNAPSSSTINIPSGTYDLTSLETGELQIETSGTGYSLSIIGAGASSTIIQQTDGKDRIFEEDFALAGSNPLTIENVTLAGGNCSNTSTNDCGFGGGAVIAGGLAGDDVTVTNVVMSNNATAAPAAGSQDGGALNFAGPNLTITNSTFSGNTANGGGVFNEGVGGGVYFLDQQAISSTANGFLTITNSSFTNNKTNGGGGGGLWAEVSTGDPLTITGSTITGNQAAGGGGTYSGGGIYVEQSGTTATTATVSNSRIVGNSATGSGNGVYVDEATANLQNNWWGCNAGPGNSGCDSVVIIDAGGFTPVLTLTLTPTASQIPANGATTLTAAIGDSGTCTGYVGNACYVPNGTPVASFNGGSLGTVSGSSSTFTSGTATSTFTAGGTAGTDTASVTVDNQTVTATIDIEVAVTVTTSPANLSITVDGTTYTAPQSFNWVVGSSHTLSTTSPQAGPAGSQYVWSSWSQGGTQSQTVSAPSSATAYTADFNTQYQLTTLASPSADGSVTPASGQYFASGATIPVTATANAGFQFNNWTSSGGSFDSTTSASTNFHMPSAAATVTGNFVPATTQITITTNPANLLVSVDGGTLTAAPLVETWNQGSTHTIATTSPQSGGTGVQYAFSSWSDSGAISHSITVPSTATIYTASFATQYQLTTAVNPSAGGTVTPTSGNYYTSGTVVPLTATANAGYSFVNWTGNVANSTSASTSITMTAPQSVTANFSLIIVAAPTTTSVSSNNNPSFTTAPGNSVTFTATVTSNTTVNEGTVTFSDTANDFACSGGNTVPVSDGQATCTTSFSTEGSRNVTATYNGTVNFQTSNGFIAQTVNNHTVVTGNQFCNQGTITVPSTAGAATPYPSNIFVTGLSGNVGAVTVSLNNISSSDIQQTDLLLVGPTGAKIIPFASVGDSSSIGGVNITLNDAASGLIPGGSPLTSGSYQPTSITGSTSLVFPAPAPLVSASNYAATDGAATLTSTFQNTAPNGTWALYAMDHSGSATGSIGGGWCVTVTPAVAPAITSANNAGFALGVASSFSVTTTGFPTPSLTEAGKLPTGVTFLDNGNGTGTLGGTPSVGGTFPITFTASNGVGSPAVQSFTLIVTKPRVSLTPTSIDFPQSYLNQVKSRNVTVKNLSRVPLTINNVSLTLGAGTNPGDFSFVKSCPGTLAGGDSCEIVVSSNAIDVGSLSATLDVADDAASSPQQVSLSATVINPMGSFNPKSLPFGLRKVGTAHTKTTTFTNIGTTTLDIDSFAITGANADDFSADHSACPSSLTPGASCQISVTFTPRATGAREAKLVVTDNAQDKTQCVVLSGQGD